MRYLTRRPPPPLSDFVTDIWLYSGYRPPHRFERILPSGTVELVVGLHDQPLRCYDPETFAVRQSCVGPLLSGARSGHCLIDTDQQREILGVHFRPGGAFAFLGMPVDEVYGQDVPLSAIWGREANDLHTRLLEIANPQRRLEIVEDVLLRRLRPEFRLDPVTRSALRQLDRADMPVAVGALADAAGWSARRFIRAFREQVGITPKAYGRIRRFQAALQRIQSLTTLDWADLAVDCGYYDQAHFIRDFREFSGLTPTAYARLQTSHLRHVPVAEHGQICPVAA